ncbi:unnamed protein product, partial [Cladocopium goreaui]
MPGGRRSGLAWQARHLRTLKLARCHNCRRGRRWTPRWFGVAGAALGDSIARCRDCRWVGAAVVWRGRTLGDGGLEWCALKNSITNALLRLSLGGCRGGLAWQARHLGTPFFFAGALPRLSLGGRRGGLAWQAWRLGTLKLTGWCVAAIVAGAVVWRGMQAALGDSMAGTCRWVAGWTLRWGLYSWRVAAIVAGWTPRWFVCRGRCGACGLYSCCVAAMIAGDAAGCRGGLVWQVWHLGTLKLVPCRDCRRDAAGRRLVSDWFQSAALGDSIAGVLLRLSPGTLGDAAAVSRGRGRRRGLAWQ